MPDSVVIAERLSLRYGPRLGVDGISFAAHRGQVTAIVGPNGAGKTSTVECCEGYRRPAAGRLQVLGRDPANAGRDFRAKIGVMLQEGGVPSAARSDETLSHFAAMYANPLDPRLLAAQLGLRGLRTPYRRMSGGERQRLKFGIAIIGRPELVFLDEPTAGMDPQGRALMRNTIRDMRDAGVSIVLTTHLLDDVEALADQVIILRSGRIIARGSPTEIASGTGRTVMAGTGRAANLNTAPNSGSNLERPTASLCFQAPPNLDLDSLRRRLPAGCQVSENPAGDYQVSGELGPEELATVTAWCAERRVMPTQLNLNHRSFERAYLDLTDSSRSLVK